MKLYDETSFGFCLPFYFKDLGESFACLFGVTVAAKFLFFMTGSTFDGVEVGLVTGFCEGLAAALGNGFAYCFVVGCVVFMGDLSLYACDDLTGVISLASVLALIGVRADYVLLYILIYKFCLS